jgi:hypothetical protein
LARVIMRLNIDIIIWSIVNIIKKAHIYIYIYIYIRVCVIAKREREYSL